MPTYSLEGKTLVRIDLDPNLERAWEMERQDAEVQNAVNQGLPKTKRTGIPFRMEMSGFARQREAYRSRLISAWHGLCSSLPLKNGWE